MDGLTALVMTIGMVYLIFSVLLFTIGMAYLAYVGFYVMVRVDLTPSAVREMRTMEVGAVAGRLNIADVLADIETQEKAAGALGYQKVGKA